MAEKPSVLKALAILNKGDSASAATAAGESAIKALPTARSRAALDKLINGQPSDYTDANLRLLLQDLLNWNGENKVNKPLIRSYGEMLKQPLLYPKLVEFTGYAMAVAPLLEADHLVKMLDSVPNTKTSFAPTAYTLSFNKNVQAAFKDLSPVRVEKIASSLWEESHRGRWWNMTAGLDNVQLQQGDVTPEELVKSLKSYENNENMENIIWSPENQEKFTKYIEKRLDKDLAKLSEKFRMDLMEGKAITPDVAIFLSSIPWLAPNQRPESPINSLLRTLGEMRKDENFHMPKKPNGIKDMFPNLVLGGSGKNGVEYLFDYNVFRLFNSNNLMVGSGENVEEVRLIVNRAQLANNANHMGNCTLTYETNMKQGQYALAYVKTAGAEYNISITLPNNNQNFWRIGEINTRHNRGGVPDATRRAITQAVAQLPAISNEYKTLLAANKEKGKKGIGLPVYTYSL